MSGAAAPLAAIPLRDGRELRVGVDGIHAGEQFFELQRVQDARQVSPNPETIALRIQGAGLIEFQPARAGDGAVALAALFRLRPELRPAGFGLEQPAANTPLPPAFPMFPPQPMMPPPGMMGPGYGMPLYPPPPPNYPPAGYRPPGYAPAPGYPLPQGMPGGFALGPPAGPLPVPPEVAAAYGPTPNAGRGELTPAPRRVGEAISATFQLLGKHLGAWLALAALAALLPQMLLAMLSSGLTLLGGRDPFAPSSNIFDAFQKAFSKQQTPPPTTDIGRLLLASTLGFVVSLVALFAASWALAALSLASRDVVLGRVITLRASLRGGLARLFPVLGYELLVGIITAVPLMIGALIGGIALGVAGVLAVSNSTSSQAPAAGAILVPAVIGGIFFLLACAVTFYLGVRLALAPYLAALSMPSPLSTSWSLVRGNWWRSFAVLLLPSVLRSILTLGVLVVAGVLLLPAAVTQIVLSPLIELLTLPLLTLAHVVLLYDLRLRREGYFVFLHERIAPPVPAVATPTAPEPAPTAQPPVPPLG